MSNPFGIQKLKNQNKPQKQTLSITNRYCSTMTNNNDDLFHNDNDILNNKTQSYPTHQINSNQDNNNLNTLFETEILESKKEDGGSNIFDIRSTHNTEIFQTDRNKQTLPKDIFSGNNDIKEHSDNDENAIKINNTNNQENQDENGEPKNIFKKEEPILYNGNEITNNQNEPIESLFDNNIDNLNFNSSNNNVLKDTYSFPTHNNIILPDTRTDANGYETQTQRIQLHETEPNIKGDNLHLLEEKSHDEEEIKVLKNEITTLKGELKLTNIKMVSIEQELQVYQKNVVSNNKIINQYKTKQLNEDFYLNEIEILKKELQEKNKLILFLENTNKKLNDTISEQKDIIQELTEKGETVTDELPTVKESEKNIEIYNDNNNNQSKEIERENDTIQKKDENIKEEKENIFTQEIPNTKEEKEYIEEIQIELNNNADNNNKINEETIISNENNNESDNVLYGIQPSKDKFNEKEKPEMTKTIENEIISKSPVNNDTLFKSSQELLQKNNQIQTQADTLDHKTKNPSPKKHKPSFDFNLSEEEDVDSLFSSIHQTSNDNKLKSSIFD